MAETKEIRKYLQQSHDKIFESNKKWAEEQKAKNPEFFEKLSAGQSPDYLWIGTYRVQHSLELAIRKSLSTGGSPRQCRLDKIYDTNTVPQAVPTPASLLKP
jgi:hypothetical protein